MIVSETYELRHSHKHIYYMDCKSLCQGIRQPTNDFMLSNHKTLASLICCLCCRCTWELCISSSILEQEISSLFKFKFVTCTSTRREEVTFWVSRKISCIMGLFNHKKLQAVGESTTSTTYDGKGQQ
jgi:hypothetical protein